MRTVPLWTVCRERRRVVSASALGPQVDHYSIPNVDAAGGALPEESESIRSDKLHVLPGDILVSRLNPRKPRVLRVESSGLPIVASTEFVPLVPRTVRPDYLLYCLTSVTATDWLDANVRSVTRSHQRVEPEVLLRVPIPMVDLGQQTAVVRFLDETVARLEQTLGHCVTAGALVGQRLDSSLLGMLREAAPAEVDVRRLLAAPAEYGLVPSQVLDEGEGPRYIRTTDIDDAGQLRPDTVKAVPAVEARRYLLRQGDVLVSRAGSIGRCHVFDAAQGQAVFAGYLVRLRFRALNPHLFRMWLRTSAFKAQVAMGAVQSTIENFNAERYKDLRMPDVPLEQQADLVRRMRAAEEHSIEATAQLERTVVLLEERKRALITACVTGKFDVSTASSRAGDAALASWPKLG